MNRSDSLGFFFARALAWFLLATFLWLPLAPWLSYPVSGITHIVLESGAPDWIRRIQKAPGGLQAETRILIAAPGAAPEGQRAELIAEGNPARYAYGLPLFLALLLAARSPRIFLRAVAGYFILLFPQAFSLILDILRQIIVVGGGPVALEISRGQMESIALGYQFGSLLLPTLAPVVLWLWLDRPFFTAVIVDGVLRRSTGARAP